MCLCLWPLSLLLLNVHDPANVLKNFLRHYFGLSYGSVSLLWSFTWWINAVYLCNNLLGF